MNRKFVIWLAIFGMAFNALWPLLANAGPPAFSAPICSMVGTRIAPAIAGGLPFDPAPGKSGAPHCPFCAPGSGDHPALATTAAYIVVAPAAVVRASNFIELFFSAFPGLAARPRGPPFLPI